MGKKTHSLHRPMQSICFTQHYPWGSHFMTKIVVGVCSQPIVSIQQGDEGMGLLAGVHLNLLHTHTHRKTPLAYNQSSHLQTHTDSKHNIMPEVNRKAKALFSHTHIEVENISKISQHLTVRQYMYVHLKSSPAE